MEADEEGPKLDIGFSWRCVDEARLCDGITTTWILMGEMTVTARHLPEG